MFWKFFYSENKNTHRETLDFIIGFSLCGLFLLFVIANINSYISKYGYDRKAVNDLAQLELDRDELLEKQRQFDVTTSNAQNDEEYTSTGQSVTDYLKSLSPSGRRYEDSIKGKTFNSNLELLLDIIAKSKMYDLDMNDAIGIAQARGIPTEYFNGYIYEKGNGIIQE
jgi:hypothetical protein